MKEIYENYEGLYDKYLNSEFEGLEVDERLLCIQMAIDNACELLEKLVDCAQESLECLKAEDTGGKKAKDAAEFTIGKIGADIGEEKGQLDIIAKIFGNK